MTGHEVKSWMTTCELRETSVTSLFKHNYADTSVSIRTGHRKLRSLKCRQHVKSGKEKGNKEILVVITALKVPSVPAFVFPIATQHRKTRRLSISKFRLNYRYWKFLGDCSEYHCL